jgi:hypothetical protein
MEEGVRAINQSYVLDGKPFESKFELLSDGREVAETYGGRQVLSSLRWDGDALAVTGEHGAAARVTCANLRDASAPRWRWHDLHC